MEAENRGLGRHQPPRLAPQESNRSTLNGPTLGLFARMALCATLRPEQLSKVRALSKPTQLYDRHLGRCCAIASSTPANYGECQDAAFSTYSLRALIGTRPCTGLL
jgi:hypothetical protein